MLTPPSCVEKFCTSTWLRCVRARVRDLSLSMCETGSGGKFLPFLPPPFFLLRACLCVFNTPPVSSSMRWLRGIHVTTTSHPECYLPDVHPPSVVIEKQVRHCSRAASSIDVSYLVEVDGGWAGGRVRVGLAVCWTDACSCGVGGGEARRRHLATWELSYVVVARRRWAGSRLC